MRARPSVLTNSFGVELLLQPSRESRRDPVTDLDRRVWRWLRDTGGYHSVREVREATGLDMPQRGHTPLARLWNRCHVVRRAERTCFGRDGWQYGVTATCTPVPGETMRPDEVAS